MGPSFLPAFSRTPFLLSDPPTIDNTRSQRTDSLKRHTIMQIGLDRMPKRVVIPG